MLMWVLAAPTDKKKMQVIQNNLLRIVRNVPWYIRNDIIHSDLDIETMDEYMPHLSRKFFFGTVNHSNDLIACEISFTSNNGKNRYPYYTTKWSLVLNPPQLQIPNFVILYCTIRPSFSVLQSHNSRILTPQLKLN
ncbi:hypothetical protein AVEN_7022-1 [Araneus ventricosus]|uniref:Uncharacterized protein n=1 Tax=Araneus ventricosus TaxID=182803 RepID=A0A4Y2C0X9_ARAVE|nr:hypothetical protein AVEN_7022-1 [Araneus ventricosus]